MQGSSCENEGVASMVEFAGPALYDVGDWTSSAVLAENGAHQLRLEGAQANALANRITDESGHAPERITLSDGIELRPTRWAKAIDDVNGKHAVLEFSLTAAVGATNAVVAHAVIDWAAGQNARNLFVDGIELSLNCDGPDLVAAFERALEPR